eukprot:5578281-Pleurochrysis_carterae.AAC.3
MTTTAAVTYLKERRQEKHFSCPCHRLSMRSPAASFSLKMSAVCDVLLRLVRNLFPGRALFANARLPGPHATCSFNENRLQACRAVL